MALLLLRRPPTKRLGVRKRGGCACVCVISLLLFYSKQTEEPGTRAHTGSFLHFLPAQPNILVMELGNGDQVCLFVHGCVAGDNDFSTN